MEKRGSGILLHITSLPSPYGVGDLGTGAHEFADFLAESRQSFWQILPLAPTCSAYGNSPYSSFSAYAGNPLLISPEKMVSSGFLPGPALKNNTPFPLNKVNYKKALKYKQAIFRAAYKTNKEILLKQKAFKIFCTENADWLDDYSLFISIKNHMNGQAWNRWPEDIRDRRKKALAHWSDKVADNILYEKFLQYLFFSQWHELKDHCTAKGIKLIGDIPIYVNYDSCDVWTNPEIFCLDKDREPVFVAGVPPDYFSATGQLWGHPVYNWNVLKRSGFSWWTKRIKQNLMLFHMFRIDHFRGFIGFWKVNANETTALNGRWAKAPAREFFNTVLDNFPDISIIAEDLGLITPDVTAIINEFGFPGMKVLLFAFGENLPTNPYAPHNHVKNCVVYTGTHDNSTIKGWYKNELDADGRKRLTEYIGHRVSEKTVNWDMIRLAMMSVADMVIIPMQDILGLGEKQRMNLPASPSGNWEWRLVPNQLSPAIVNKLKKITMIYGRDNTH